MAKLKRWKYRGKPLLIPDQHEPGNQRGFRASNKRTKEGKSEHSSKSVGSVGYWKLGRWAGGDVK